MVASPVFKHIYFDDFSATPKYQQLANCILKAIEKGKLQTEDVLPSINEVSFHFEISRDTVEKGYKLLKRSGVLGSVPGKGYYIMNAEVDKKLKIFLLFNKLSAHKKIIYDALVGTLGDYAAVDFYIYNNDMTLFKKMLTNCNEDYDYYVIMPHFWEVPEMANKLLNTLPKEKLILLDKIIPGITGTYGAIYEDFETDIYHALEEALPQLKKYHTLHLVFPTCTYYPKEIQNGFFKFCQNYAFNQSIIDNIKKHPLQKGEVYITLLEDDLVTLVETIVDNGFEIGSDIGVISYNEVPLKKIIMKGITTISTDFNMMGEKAAEMILNKSKEHIKVNFYLTLRNSL